MNELVFLKLGGSLITDKTRPYTPRLDIMDALAADIQAALLSHPNLTLILGHGAGSFGHVPAKQYRTREGLPHTATEEQRAEYWHGFSEVWYQASELNRHIMHALHKAGVRAMSFSPAASVTAENGKISEWDLNPIRQALAAGIVPVVQGDVIFDKARGGTILSTEDLFMHLTRQLEPQRLLLAGIEAGVWEDFPARKNLVECITPANISDLSHFIGGSAAADVTGGMESKVQQMLELVQQTSIASVLIFSGEEKGNVKKALTGQTLGTQITT